MSKFKEKSHIVIRVKEIEALFSYDMIPQMLAVFGELNAQQEEASGEETREQLQAFLETLDQELNEWIGCFGDVEDRLTYNGLLNNIENDLLSSIDQKLEEFRKMENDEDSREIIETVQAYLENVRQMVNNAGIGSSTREDIINQMQVLREVISHFKNDENNEAAHETPVEECCKEAEQTKKEKIQETRISPELLKWVMEHPDVIKRAIAFLNTEMLKESAAK